MWLYCRTVPFPGTPDSTRICVKGGFDPALLYELTYTAKDPYVLGVGMAAMRDVVSFFRYSEKDAAGTANPLFGLVPHVVSMGNSQSGRFAKAFLNLGFNEDLRGRIVWAIRARSRRGTSRRVSITPRRPWASAIPARWAC